MKKIIAAFDGLNYSESTRDYALHYAKQINAHLVGVFMEDVTRHSYSVSEVTHYEGSFDEHVKRLDKKDKDHQNLSISLFEAQCRDAGISFNIHRDRNVALQELLHESIYADLMIIDRKETMSRHKEMPPTRFIRDLLSDIQCPVLIVPSSFKPVEKTGILYDGEPSSVFAVKMFNYLMNEDAEKSIEIIAAVKDGDTQLPDKFLIKEFVKQHHPAAEFVILKGEPESGIVNYLLQQKEEMMLVLGAYRRSRMSRVFRPSMADVLMSHLNYPLFIAHNK